MKNFHKQLLTRYVPGFLALMLMFSSCNENEDPVYPHPSIAIDGDDLIEVKRGEPIHAVFNLNAEGGNKELLVYRDGGLLEAVPLSPEASSYTYSGQSVPNDAEEGQEFVYGFSLVNSQDSESARIELTVSTLAYDPVTIGSQVLYEVSIPEDGIIENDYRFVSGRDYYINHTMDFQEGTSLTIDENVGIYIKAGTEPLIDIVIRPGATISLQGSAASPVVATSERALTGEAAPGDWGVFNIRGNGNGSDSGIIEYLRLEYGTARNFRLQEVGNGTTIQYVQVYRADGEGVMPTNGDVDLKYIVATECNGGGFRFGSDYSGNVQFGIVNISATLDDNSEVDIRETASPVISNFTVIGPGTEAENTAGIRMRSSSSGKIYNSIVASFPRRGLRLNDEVTITDLEGPTVFAYSYVFDVDRDPYRDDTDNGNPFQGHIDPSGDFQNPFFNNVTGLDGDDPVLLSIPGVGTNSFIPDAEQASDFDPSTLGEPFDAAAFVGAIKDADSDWTVGWVKNPDGSVR